MSDVYFPNVVLLWSADGADANTGPWTDVTGKTLTRAGDAQLDTAQFKFGTASALFDGTGDVITTPDHASLNLGSNDFTIELWIRPAATATSNDILAKRATSAGFGSFLVHQSSTALTFFAGSTGTSWDIASTQTVGTIAANTWYHVAITRQGSTWRAYLNGVQGSTWSSSASMFNDATALSIGADADATAPYNGWVDEIRITKGIARYTGAGSFTPPVSAFDTSGPSIAAAATRAATTASGAGNSTGLGLKALPIARGSGNMLASATRVATTASGTGVAGSVADGLATRAATTASGSSPGNFGGAAAPSRLATTALGYGPYVSGATRKATTAVATGLVGGIGQGIVQRVKPVVLAAGTAVGRGTGSILVPLRSASASGMTVGAGVGVASRMRSQGRASGLSGTVGRGAATRARAVAAASGYVVQTGAGAVLVARRTAYSMGQAQTDGTFRAWAMNTRHNAVTEYTSFPYNSLVRYNGGYLAAGAGGLFTLGGADDAGAPIDWKVRTGQLDDGKPGLKRMTELLVGSRYDGPIRVRVFPRDSVAYDYALANYVPNYDLHQARVKVGKGLRSRYYKVEVSGSGTRFELDSMQMTLPQVSRRLG